jgi:hypothetical protein
VFVPDGNRRLVLATTDLPEGSDEFYTQVALAQTSCGLDNLKVFFSHGLPILFTPLFSRSVLGRGPGYQRLTALETLKIIFAGDTWLGFYAARDVRVRVYGDLSVLAQPGCEQALGWIERAQQITRTHTAHTLFIGIGGVPRVGHDAMMAAARFYRERQREPSADELVEFLYGQPVPQADFFLMNCKLGGLGALPALIGGGDTQVYYLPAPGVLALTERTYRAILYDLLYMRPETAAREGGHVFGPKERARLHDWYDAHKGIVIGVGGRIGNIWVPDQSPRFD